MIKDTYREWRKARSHFFTDFRSLDKDERDQFISLCQIADPETGTVFSCEADGRGTKMTVSEYKC